MTHSFHVFTSTLAVVLEQQEQSKVVMEDQDQNFMSFLNENTTYDFNIFKTLWMTWHSLGEAIETKNFTGIIETRNKEVIKFWVLMISKSLQF